ncbi:TPA: hypothetical protein ACGUUK_004443 [Vibrio vulnificus]
MEELNKKIVSTYHAFETESKFSNVSTCLLSSCNKKAILSHSQQKNGSLKYICGQDKKVYALRDSMAQSFDVKTGQVNCEFVPTPISKASRYLGVCDEHDTSLFKVIENCGFEHITEEQVAALYYRSMSYEYFRKKREVERNKYLWDKIGLELPFHAQIDFYKFYLWQKDYYDNTVKLQLSEIDKIISGGKYNELCHYKIEIDKNLGVSCSAMINMHLDRYFEFLDVYDDYIPSFSFNVIPFKDKTYIILTWLKKNDKFMKDILLYSGFDFDNFLNRLVFCESEDVCVNPTLWESIDDETKKKIYNNMSHPYQRGALDLEDVPIVLRAAP